MADFGSFKIFRELRITGAPERLHEVGEAMQAHLPGHWQRAREREEDNAAMFSHEAGPLFVFERAATEDLPAAGLAMLGSEEGLSVINIVPLELHQLSIGQYNAILGEFFEAAVKPAVAALQLTAHLTDDTASITKWLSEPAAGALRRFSNLANHSTGSAHPRDRERWFAFLVLAHRDRSTLDTDMLKRWLVEEGGWSPDMAGDLAIEYEFARDLLRFADGTR
ncbi:MAG: hypothetical protein RBS40_04845 [Rhodocyclaceae bacterium]|jgi:hypothetical protein|nr:hypothetical protein [Rhodocyclaceae bacterium]